MVHKNYLLRIVLYSKNKNRSGLLFRILFFFWGYKFYKTLFFCPSQQALNLGTRKIQFIGLAPKTLITNKKSVVGIFLKRIWAVSVEKI